MADPKLIHVDIYGNEVSENDPASQSKYNAAELRALRKGGFFPKRGDDEVVDAADDAADEERGTPVMHSGVGAHDDAEDDEEPDADAKPPAKTVHGKR